MQNDKLTPPPAARVHHPGARTLAPVPDTARIHTRAVRHQLDTAYARALANDDRRDTWQQVRPAPLQLALTFAL
jgi:hypothetical protein